MSAPTAHLLAGLLLDVGLKSTPFLLVGLGADRALRRASAATRHAVWATVFAALPVLAVAAWSARGQDLAVEATWIASIWAIGAAIAAAPLIAGRLWLGAVARRGQPEDGVIRARPDDVSGPLTFGWWRPVIVVPHDWSAWPAAHREAALRHERAHIARRDWLVHCAAHLIAAALWFQPLVWLARSRLALAAEHATDDHVLGAGMRPSDYAAALLHIGQRPTARHGLAAGSATATRIRDVLAERPRTTRRWPVLVGAALLCAAALPALAALSPWSPPSEPPQCVDSPPLVFL